MDISRWFGNNNRTLEDFQMDRLLLSLDEVATMLGMKTQVVRRLSRTGELPTPIKIVRSLRWRRLEIEKWCKEQPSEESKTINAT